ncbi:MAG TPA: hypothetical protein VL462_00070 [Candidatus Nitrosotalea sp.]|jgi:hypothetical protein|nr:hypothetical protein [Candidatus Nitrosotalea sp.]
MESAPSSSLLLKKKDNIRGKRGFAAGCAGGCGGAGAQWGRRGGDPIVPMAAGRSCKIIVKITTFC